MIIGIDIDNTITHTTEMIMHYAKIYGEEQGLNTVRLVHSISPRPLLSSSSIIRNKKTLQRGF
jgi:hypothetical protein